MTRTQRARRLQIAIILIAITSINTVTSAQNGPQTAPRTVQGKGLQSTPACPDAASLKAADVYGRWQARFAPAPRGLPATATLTLSQHAEFSDSLAGSVDRDLAWFAASTLGATPLAKPSHAANAELAGDLDAGFLLLDESSDRISISGTWNAELVKGSCGKQFSGTWRDTSARAEQDHPDGAPDVPFTLTRLP